MRHNTICIDEKYSTTRLLKKEKPVIINNLEDKFKTTLLFPENEGRKGEGGLRTKGYFKKSYDDKPLVSIITVVYNGEKYLEETIQSIINQTYDNIEYIIIDGESTDGTLDIIRKYENQIDYWISERDKGIYDAMNKGLNTITGEIVSFLNADDTYIDQSVVLRVVSNFSRKRCDMLHAKIIQKDEDNKVIATAGGHLPKEKLLLKMKIAHPSVFVTKKVYLQYGLFNTKYKIAADYDLMLRIWDRASIYFMDDILVTMRIGGVSNTLVYASYREARDIGIKHGLNVIHAYINFVKEILKHKILIEPYRSFFK